MPWSYLSYSVQEWGWRVTLKNLKWELAYKLGGFTRAWNYTDEELRCGEAQEIVRDMIREYKLCPQDRSLYFVYNLDDQGFNRGAE